MARGRLSLRRKRIEQFISSEGEHVGPHPAKTAGLQPDTALLQQRGNLSLQSMRIQRPALIRAKKSKPSDSPAGTREATLIKKLSEPDWYAEFPITTMDDDKKHWSSDGH